MIREGQIWLETKTNRHIKILDPDYADCVVSWTYIDSQGNPQPHGYESSNGITYNDWCFHCCDAFDFCVWRRFRLVCESVVEDPAKRVPSP